MRSIVRAEHALARRPTAPRRIPCHIARLVASRARTADSRAGPIAHDEQGHLATRYDENLFGRNVVTTGRLSCDGRIAQSSMTCTSTGRLFFLGLQAPTPPANLIGGMLSGAALYDFEARTVSGRIVFLRDHGVEPQNSPSAWLHGCLAGIDRPGARQSRIPRRPQQAVAAEQLLAFLEAPPARGLIEIRAETLGQLSLSPWII